MNIPQVPSAHITFRCNTFTIVLTENGRRQVLWEIALVDSFSHTLSALCQSSTCQEIGLVALMFFFELLFLCFFAISFYVSLTNLSSIILFLIC